MTTRDLRVVLVVPATNTTMAPELQAHWPEITEIPRVGVPRPMRPIVVGDLPEYRDNTLNAVAPLASSKPDIVLYGCTTAGFLSGPAGDNDMCQALADAVGVPAVTTASAMVQALRHAGVNRPAIVTPYLQASNDGLRRFLSALGIEIAVLDSFYLKTAEAYDHVTEDQVRELALATGKDPVADGLFIACTQLPTLGILDDLRAKLKKPVWGAIQATAWAGKRALNLPA